MLILCYVIFFFFEYCILLVLSHVQKFVAVYNYTHLISSPCILHNTILCISMYPYLPSFTRPALPLRCRQLSWEQNFTVNEAIYSTAWRNVTRYVENVVTDESFSDIYMTVRDTYLQSILSRTEYYYHILKSDLHFHVIIHFFYQAGINHDIHIGYRYRRLRNISS